MSHLFSERLRSARSLNGFSLQDLADKLDNKITRQSLHRYEKGEVLPDSERIAQLSKALGVRPDFFFRETKVEIGSIEFRKVPGLSSKEEDKLIETVKDKLSRYLELEEILSFKTAFKNPVSQARPVKSPEDIEAAAQAVRKDWGLGSDPIANCLELLEDHHIKIIEVETEASFDGLQTWVNENIPVIAINTTQLKSNDRKRFTALHELAHLLLPLKGLNEKQKETCCHQFAAALLLPKETAYRELGKVRHKLLIQELGPLKQQYGISIQAIVMRAKSLNIISENYARQLFFHFDQMGWREQEPFEYITEEKSNRFTQLLFRALGEELISMSKAAALNNQSLSEFKEKSLMVG
jgi:Zn-dependent peptidase ImmA (M78 family)/transcriptional regulator with XRE-family HTH domain